ncbi:MAG: response regulator [Chloroflexi bacterium]|nr:response regulator [Chloroflexota bacterium]MBV9602260.1 response regulator [Chloroflexota bacterium]
MASSAPHVGDSAGLELKSHTPVRVLLVDDDEDDWVLVRDALHESAPCRYLLDWSATWEDGLAAIARGDRDVYLVDYRLGERSGIDLIREAIQTGLRAPFILLTGVGDQDVDQTAARVGAADYLVKGRLDGELLDRSIRYALERRRGEERAVAVARAEVAQADAEHARAQLQQLIATIAHDLLQPLAAIRGRAQLLQRQSTRPDSTERLVEGLERIVQTATGMADQLDELVAASRAEMTLVLERSPTDLSALVRQAVSGAEQTTDKHVFRCELPESDATGNWDAGRLSRVLNNLLSNAVKYSPEGGEVVVRVSAAPGCATLMVEDHGLGIPAADLPRVFEPFHRGRNAERSIAGAGIGLASVRQIVEAHGGSVEVDSQVGAGSTFTVRLPR